MADEKKTPSESRAGERRDGPMALYWECEGCGMIVNYPALGCEDCGGKKCQECCPARGPVERD